MELKRERERGGGLNSIRGYMVVWWVFGWLLGEADTNKYSHKNSKIIHFIRIHFRVVVRERERWKIKSVRCICMHF